MGDSTQPSKTRFYASAFRGKVYGNLDQLPVDVDDWVHSYNTEGTHLALAKQLDQAVPTINPESAIG